LVHMSYFCYMTNHYQNARNDHTNATKATKYIQQYTYNKSASKSETTENETYHKTPRKHFIHWATQIPTIR